MKEDKNAKLTYDLVFVYFMTFNFVLRTEDDDFIPLDYSVIYVLIFIFQMDCWIYTAKAEICYSEDAKFFCAW